MPNKSTHLKAGRRIGLTEYQKWIAKLGRPYNFWEATICSIVGGKAAELPDILEPATSPTHRRIAHSHELDLLLVSAGPKASGEGSQDFSNLLWDIGRKGYRSHLSMDQRTTAGLYSVLGNLLKRFLNRF